MFKIDQSPTFRWDVKFQNLQENGQVKEETFTAIFKRKTRAELMQYKDNKEMPLVDAVSELLVGWDGIHAEDGSPVAYNATAKTKLLDIAGMAEVIFLAFEEAVKTGLKLKN